MSFVAPLPDVEQACLEFKFMPRALTAALALIGLLAAALPAHAIDYEAGGVEGSSQSYGGPAPDSEGGYQVAFNEWYGARTYPAPPPPRQMVQPYYGGGDDYYVPGGGGMAMPAQRYQPYQYGVPEAEQPRVRPRTASAPTTTRRKKGPAPEFMRAVVPYDGTETAGTVVVDTPSRYLYLVQGDGTAIRYGIGVGKPGFEWSGEHEVTSKKEWPGWTPPAEMLARRPDLPRHMEGGPQNPLGARALYLGSTLYRIHGSNEPWSIGHAVSSGCIRMTNEDVIDLYGRVPVGAKVIVI